MSDLLLFTITILCSFTALRRPVYGMLAYICFSLLAPHNMTWYAARTFPHAQLIAICTVVGYFFWSESKRFPRQREFTLLLILWGTFGFSTLFALSADTAFDQFIHISKILLMVCLSMSLINTEDRLHLLVLVLALSIGFYGLKIGIFVLMTGGHTMIFGPDNSFLAANNSLGMALAMNVPLLFYLAKLETHLWLRWIMKAMLVFSYPAVAGTFTRGAWVALAVMTSLIVVKSKSKLLTLTVAGILVIMAAAWLPQIASQEMSARYDKLVNYKEDESAQSRYWNWELCTRVGLARPLYGGGFDFYSPEVYRTFFPEFIQRWPGKVWACHSMWLTILGEHGVLAFLLWIGLLGSCLLSLRQMRSYAKVHAELTWIMPYIDMTQAAFIGFMISGTFLDIAYFEVYYFLVVIVVIMKERIRDKMIEVSSMAIDTVMDKTVLSHSGSSLSGR